MIKRLFMLPALIFLMSCNASDEQIKKWVENNPEVIMQALMKFQQDQEEQNRPQPAMVGQYSSELFKNAGSPTAGSGSIEIAYFFDFNCGHCARQSETIKAVLEKSNNVKVTYKNLPILGPGSEFAARAALAAHLQNRFKDFYEEVYKTRERDLETFKGIASRLGLDVAKWEKDLEAEAVNQELSHVRTLAENMKIRGTPVLAIAPDKIFPGRVDQLMEIVNSMN